MLARKVACTLLLVAWVGLLLAGLGALFTVAHHFEHALEAKAPALPQLTRVALMMVGNAGLDGGHHPAHIAFVIVLLAVPVALLVAVWRAADRVALLEVLVLGGGSYLVAVAAVFALLVFALWLPYSSL